tara:strand:+ start:188 stop:601 length:414 start_codon:yes stop_codon:yes gene_type:complete
MIERKETKYIVIHCADTPADMDIGVETIRKWHVEERGWDDVGYHYIIKRDGKIEPGRDVKVQAAHARAVNSNSVGICLVGRGDNFTEDQFFGLHNLINTLNSMYDNLEIIGHSDVEPKKPHCPGFNVKEWVQEEFYG